MVYPTPRGVSPKKHKLWVVFDCGKEKSPAHEKGKINYKHLLSVEDIQIAEKVSKVYNASGS